MDRRALLHRLGGAAAVASTGCIAAPPEASPDTTTTSSPTTTTTPRPDSCARTLGDRRLYCVGESDDDPPLDLSVTVADAALPTAAVSASVTNTADERFSATEYSYDVQKYERGRWRHVWPWAVPAYASWLEPGSRYEWQVRADNTDLAAPTPPDSTDEIVLRLGPGAYSFAFDGGFEGDDRGVTLAHRFELSGDRLPLEPTQHVRDVTRSGDSVQVTSERPGLHEYGPRRATLTVTRAPGATTPSGDRHYQTDFLLEHLYNGVPPGLAVPLRNALAHFERGVETVSVETDAHTSPAFAVHAPTVVSVEGRTYRLETTDPERD